MESQTTSWQNCHIKAVKIHLSIYCFPHPLFIGGGMPGKCWGLIPALFLGITPGNAENYAETLPPQNI